MGNHATQGGMDIDTDRADIHMMLGAAWVMSHPFLAASDVIDAASELALSVDEAAGDMDTDAMQVAIADEIVQNCEAIRLQNNAMLFNAAYAKIQKKFALLDELARRQPHAEIHGPTPC
jgi:hypothetical protein